MVTLSYPLKARYELRVSKALVVSHVTEESSRIQQKGLHKGCSTGGGECEMKEQCMCKGGHFTPPVETYTNGIKIFDR